MIMPTRKPNENPNVAAPQSIFLRFIKPPVLVTVILFHKCFFSVKKCEISKICLTVSKFADIMTSPIKAKEGRGCHNQTCNTLPVLKR